MQPSRLLDRGLGLVSQRGVDFDRDVALQALPAVPDRAHQIAGVTDVLGGECDEDLLRVLLGDEPAQLLVVGVPLRERLLEDGRVRRQAADGVLLHHPRELAPMHEVAGEEIDPDALAERGQPVEP